MANSAIFTMLFLPGELDEKYKTLIPSTFVQIRSITAYNQNRNIACYLVGIAHDPRNGQTSPEWTNIAFCETWTKATDKARIEQTNLNLMYEADMEQLAFCLNRGKMEEADIILNGREWLSTNDRRKMVEAAQVLANDTIDYWRRELLERI